MITFSCKKIGLTLICGDYNDVSGSSDVSFRYMGNVFDHVKTNKGKLPEKLKS